MLVSHLKQLMASSKTDESTSSSRCPGVASIVIYRENPNREELIEREYDSVEDFAVGLANITKEKFPEHYEIICHWLVPKWWITFDRYGDVDCDKQHFAVINVLEPKDKYDIRVPYSSKGRVKAEYKEMI